ncbi:hypothetical protein CLOBOL_03515 [Enterocloster bolteae ATCC BAA-613]|uniref:Uncharacterized protein n=1 Tax=Enterocloster bolteae (strain ATCC BAA-613 / DSM 15670 / CCUG 46953 / JCM 12243 / WAL 16351) TaxID=411902 RepID=A8RT16_ENTBW|nr:hypothetical protein CLOBOL_03515 [Enterocloster bolteae ATCC BAA-613]
MRFLFSFSHHSTNNITQNFKPAEPVRHFHEFCFMIHFINCPCEIYI